jgi:hypothetical protein
MSDDDYDNDEKLEFVVGYDQYGQIGQQQKSGVAGLGTVRAGVPLKKDQQIKLAQMAPEDRFKELVSNYYNTYAYPPYTPLSMLWETIISKISQLKFVGYKNPLCFIFALKCIDNNKISKEKLDSLFITEKASLEVEGIRKEDIIRYARIYLQ